MYPFRFFAGTLGVQPPLSARNVAASLGYTGSSSLRVVMLQPRPPISLSPSGSQVPIQNVQLSWQDPGVTNYNRATKYHLSLTPGDLTADIAAPSTTFTIPHSLFFETPYQWSVQSINDHGASAPSTASFFTIMPPPPTNLAPNTQNVIQPVTFSWTDPGVLMGSPALEFEVQVSGIFADGHPSPQTFHFQQPGFTFPFVILAGSNSTWEVRSKYPAASSAFQWSGFSQAQFTVSPS